MGRNIVKRSRFTGYKGMDRIGRESRRKMKEIMETENTPSGLIAAKTIEEIATMHGKDLGYAMEQLQAGIKVEMEHTDNEETASTIALHHLEEDMDYYIKLVAVESDVATVDEKSLVKTIDAQGIIHLRFPDAKIPIPVQFSSTYDRNTLTEFLDEIEESGEYSLEDVIVRKVVVVNTDQWEDITNNLLNPRAELWEKIGDDMSTYVEGPITGVALFNKDTQEAIIINSEGTDYVKSIGTDFDAIVISNMVNSLLYGKFEAMEEMQGQDIEKTEFDSELEKINHIRRLIDEKGDDVLKYSEKELALLNSYEGMGGQAKKVEKGTHDVGILDQFYTPYTVIEKMIGLAVKHGFTFTSGKKIMEPSCGIGRFFEYIPKYCSVLGFEIDKYAATIAKLKFPDFRITNDSFETLFFNAKRYVEPAADFDLVLGNPPYREFISKWAVIKDVMNETEKTRTLAETYDQYFIMRGVDLLKSGGLLVFIVPNTFLSNDNKYNAFKEKLNQKAELVDAYRLPGKIFPNTDISTDIIVLRKR